MKRIQIRYTRPWSWLLTILGAPPRWSDIRIKNGRARVRMSFMFRAKFDVRDVQSVDPYRPCVSIGAHGWSGRWLVNGAHRPIARVLLSKPAPAFILGFPVALRELLVSVDDVGALRTALLT